MQQKDCKRETIQLRRPGRAELSQGPTTGRAVNLNRKKYKFLSGRAGRRCKQAGVRASGGIARAIALKRPIFAKFPDGDRPFRPSVRPLAERRNSNGIQTSRTNRFGDRARITGLTSCNTQSEHEDRRGRE